MRSTDTKNDRIAVLKQLISNHQLGSQDELLKALSKRGFVVTQATLSRDLKKLKVAKTANARGQYVYVLPDETMYKRVHRLHMASIDPMLASGFENIQFSGNMAVIKTKPGYASGIALHLDQAQLPEVLGTIAGDDTIFIVIKQGVPLTEVLDSLETVIPGVNNHLV